MPRLKPAKRLQLEAFWRSHLKAWRDGELNQREYCERHGLSLKRFGNWRAKAKGKDTIVPEGLLWRRGGLDRTGASTKTREIHPPPLRRRRNYSDADKRRLIEEATRENASVSGVARKYGISTDLMFRWRRKLGVGPMHRIVPVTITGFEMAEIDLLLAAPEAERDPADEVPAVVAAQPVTRRGDVWTIGRHRLICGDATDAATYERLLDGSRAQMVFTDPPYNVPVIQAEWIGRSCARQARDQHQTLRPRRGLRTPFMSL